MQGATFTIITVVDLRPRFGEVGERGTSVLISAHALVKLVNVAPQCPRAQTELPIQINDCSYDHYHNIWRDV
jgi:hypothetical protein